MPCEALQRGTYKAPGWTCTGDDLITVLFAKQNGHTIPVVIPSWAEPQVMATEVGASAYAPQPFAGGDHLHLVLEGPMNIVTTKALAAGFAEWMRRYNEDRAQFETDWLSGSADPADYGINAAEYLLKVLRSQGAVGTLAPETERYVKPQA
jgi:hypothetical protein